MQHNGEGWFTIQDLPNAHKNYPAVVSFGNGESVWFIAGMKKKGFIPAGTYCTCPYNVYVPTGKADFGRAEFGRIINFRQIELKNISFLKIQTLIEWSMVEPDFGRSGL
jgi:hypothetical protein